MPTFECTRCNDCFTKKKAEAHMMGRCSQAMTCVDCNVVFDPTTIKAHTNCITETDKYAGKWLAKQKDVQKKEPREPKAPFVPPLPYALDDSDGDSDIAIPQQSPISGPKPAVVAPTVISLVYADDASRRHREKVEKVTALQNGTAREPAAKAEKDKKERKEKKAKTAEAAEGIGAETDVQETKKKSKKEKASEPPAAETDAVENGAVAANGDTKKEKKEKKDKKAEQEVGSSTPADNVSGKEGKKRKHEEAAPSEDAREVDVSEKQKKKRHAEQEA
eukprot:EG_transcript_22939